MTIPVMKEVLAVHTSLHILFVSSISFAPLFIGIDRLHFVGVDLQGRHRGIFGMWRLMKDCKHRASIDAVADLHSVLRTWVLGFFFRFSGLPVASIYKGRFQKWKLTRRRNKVKRPLPSTFQRYQHVFQQLGFPLQLNESHKAIAENWVLKNNYKIGIAPFAKHKGKMLPLATMKQAIQLLLQEFDCTVYLFGGPGQESVQLMQWAHEIPNLVNCAGSGNLQEELNVLSKLDLLISMDSANMHLASLYSIPVISIWGATHPYAGFLGWGQTMDRVIQSDLHCQPCSVFGNKSCYRGDWACLHAIQPYHIVDKVRAYLCNE